MRNDTESDLSPRPLTRRKILGGLGLSFMMAPLGQLIGCAPAEEEAPEDDKGAGGWATGGTAAMIAASTYPDPFAAGPGAMCKLTCAQIPGPCYGATLERKDVSEGQDGLPLRVAFLVLDEACNPIEGVEVDIWHAGPDGNYSGDDIHPSCTHEDPEATAAHWFRGVQKTDARGRVDFDTCFPGWYVGRAVHIHLTIRKDGQELVTSQIYFEDSLLDSIITTQPLYDTRGERDTRNTDDIIVDQAQVADFMFQTQRMSDGAMLAWKALVLRTATDEELCDATSQTMKDLIESGVDPNDPDTFPEGFPP